MTNDLIKQFFEKRLITTFNTQKSYRGNINKYFRLIGKDINTYFDNTPESIENDLNKAYLELNKKGVPLLSMKTLFNSVKQFLCWEKGDKELRREIKELEIWDILKAKFKGASPISEEFVPNTIDLKTVLSHGNALSRAMYLMMASSGCRIGEILALTEHDIDTDSTPTKLTVNKTYNRSSKNYTQMFTKTRKKRICFISNEATNAYLEWMKERDAWIKHAAQKSKRYNKDRNDPRIFPMTDSNAVIIWTNLVKKSKMYKENTERDTRTGRLILHPHCLRKFFRSYFGNADYANHLMGHATDMDKFYRNKKKEDLAELYLQHVHNVTVFETPTDVSGLHNRIDEKDKQLNDIQKSLSEKDKQLNDMQKVMNEMKIEMIELRATQTEQLLSKISDRLTPV